MIRGNIQKSRRQSGQVEHQFHALQRRTEALGARRDPVIDSHLTLLEHDPTNWALLQMLTLMLDEYEAEQRPGSQFVSHTTHVRGLVRSLSSP